ncbi:MAG: RDD family protein [Mycobacterium sp.]
MFSSPQTAAQDPGSVVTGDAVVLDVQLAQLPVRAVGALIDIVVMFVGYLLGLMLWAATLADYDPALSAAVMIIFTVLVLLGYPLAFETATRGRSLGKMAMGLRVVSEDGSPERFRQALFRSLSAVIEIWLMFGGPAVICSLVSPKGKRIGDVFAGTVVISERGPKLSPPPPMPPNLAWWAASLQLSGLGTEQAELARQFLSRAPHLDSALRDQMAYRIAGEVLARISPPPPPGTPPQYVLAAVLAERHRRELDRLARRAGPPAPPMPAPAWPVAPWPPPQQPAIFQQPAAFQQARPPQPPPPSTQQPSAAPSREPDGFTPPV